MHITCVPIRSMSYTGFAETPPTHAEGIILRYTVAPYLDCYPHPGLFIASTISAAPTMKPRRTHHAGAAGLQAMLGANPCSSFQLSVAMATLPNGCYPDSLGNTVFKGTLYRPGKNGSAVAAPGREGGRRRGTPRSSARWALQGSADA